MDTAYEKFCKLAETLGLKLIKLPRGRAYLAHSPLRELTDCGSLGFARKNSGQALTSSPNRDDETAPLTIMLLPDNGGFEFASASVGANGHSWEMEFYLLVGELERQCLGSTLSLGLEITTRVDPATQQSQTTYTISLRQPTNDVVTTLLELTSSGRERGLR